MKNFIIYFLYIGIFFLIIPFFSKAFAASFSLDPATVSTPSGQTFDIKVDIDTGTDNVKSGDAWIIYNPAVLQADTVADGTFFTTVYKDLSTSGKVYISGLVDDPTKPVKGKGTIGTVSFKALTDGTDTLKFDCVEGSTNNTSVILKADSSDANLIVCSQNTTSTVTVGTGVNPTPTSALEPTGIPTPSVLPRTGVFENVVKFAVPGAILLFVGTVARLLL